MKYINWNKNFIPIYFFKKKNFLKLDFLLDKYNIILYYGNTSNKYLEF